MDGDCAAICSAQSQLLPSIGRDLRPKRAAPGLNATRSLVRSRIGFAKSAAEAERKIHAPVADCMNLQHSTITTTLRGGLPAICRLTFLDRLAVGFAAGFLFLMVAAAISAHLAIGEAPAARMWGFFGYWALAAFAVGVAGPWLLCRLFHASAVFGEIVLREMNERTAQRTTSMEPSATATVG